MALKVLLIRPPYCTQTYDPELQECLGIELLAAILRKEGYQVKLIDALFQNLSATQVVQQAISFAPDIIGFSLMSEGSLEDTRLIANQLQQKLSEKVIYLAGGHFFSSNPEGIRYLFPAIHFVVCHEGERSLLQILQYIKEGKSFDDISGLVSIDNSQIIRINPPEIPIQDLDTLPFPSRDFIDTLQYAHLPANMQGSRGCTGKCAFCTTPILTTSGTPPWRFRSALSMVEEIELLYHQYNLSTFNFIDDNFLGPVKIQKNRIEIFVNGIEKHHLKIAFGIQCRIHEIDIENFKKLYQAGLRYVFSGIESGVSSTMKIYQKNHHPTKTHSIIIKLQNIGFHVEIGYIPFHPWTKLESLIQEYKYLKRLDCFNFRTALNRLEIYPETPLFRKLAQTNPVKINRDGSLIWTFFNQNVEHFYETLTVILSSIQPLWTFVVANIPPLILKLAVKPESRIQLLLNNLFEIRQTLDLWIEKVVLFCLHAFQNNQNENIDIFKLKRDGRNLIHSDLKRLKSFDYGRINRIAVEEIEEIS